MLPSQGEGRGEMTNSTFTEGATVLTGLHKTKAPLCPSQVTEYRSLVIQIKQRFPPISPSNTWKLNSIVALILPVQLVEKLLFFSSFRILTR